MTYKLRTSIGCCMNNNDKIKKWLPKLLMYTDVSTNLFGYLLLNNFKGILI